MGLTDRLSSAWREFTRSGTVYPLSFQEWVNLFRYGGNSYLYGLQQTLPGQKQELADGSFGGFASMAYRGNGAIFAVEMVRLAIFSEARFQFRRLRSGRPGELFGTEALRLLEQPWPNGTTSSLLLRMLQDTDLAGNAFVARRPDRLRILRPDWVTIALGSLSDPSVDGWDADAEVIGYLYHPGGRGQGRTPEVFGTREVAHFIGCNPDPQARFRGMSWLTPLVREIGADSAATAHKLQFFENGATPNLVVRLDKDSAASKTPTAFKEWVKVLRDEIEPKNAAGEAYKTMYLGGGADVTLVGRDLQQMDFKATQGAGESRIAAAGGVPAPIVGFSEGLAGSSLNAGNYGMARRRLADGTMRPLWRDAAGALASITDVPAGAELWYDDRDIKFLQEDLKDAAEVASLEAQTIRTLTDAGFQPESIIAAVQAGDWTQLAHTGLYSVQLQPPTTTTPEPAPQNGKVPPELVEA